MRIFVIFRRFMPIPTISNPPVDVTALRKAGSCINSKYVERLYYIGLDIHKKKIAYCINAFDCSFIGRER